MCFHVPSFAFLTFGPAMWLTAQDQPTIGNAATIRIIPAASTTIGLKKISRIRFIFRFLSFLAAPHVILCRLPVRKNDFSDFVAPAVTLSDVHTIGASIRITCPLRPVFSTTMMFLCHQDPPLRTGFLPFPANFSGRSSLMPRTSTRARWSFGIW